GDAGALPGRLGAGAVLCGLVLLFAASARGLASAAARARIGRGTPLPSAMPHRLVVAGPYRWVRNPMAVAGIGQGIAVGLLGQSWLVIAYALAGAVLWHLLVRPEEERDLASRFGADYEIGRASCRGRVSGWSLRAE